MEKKGFSFAPNVLDGVFQSPTLAIQVAEEQKNRSFDLHAYLPQSVEKIVFRKGQHEIKHSIAHLKSVTPTSGICDFMVYDKNETPILKMLNFRANASDLVRKNISNPYFEYLPIIVETYNKSKVLDKLIISYFCVNVDQINLWRKKLNNKIIKKLEKLFNNSVYKPLPYRSFSVHDIKQSFKYMQQAKHIGKVVVDMEGVNHVWPLVATNDTKEPEILFEGAYLITGGPSGLGLEIAKWLVDKGVQKLILVSRRGELDVEDVEYFHNKNVETMMRSVDISSIEQIKRLRNELFDLGVDVKGIVHTATAYHDDFIENMTEENYKTVLYTKALGAYYLDEVFSASNLHDFILCSSATTLFGNIGQVNYVVANSYLESLVHARRLRGKAASYIAFGPISDVGYIARNENLKKSMENQLQDGFISSKEAINSIQKVLTEQLSGLAVMRFHVGRMAKAMPIFNSSRFDVLRMTESDVPIDNKDFASYIKSLSTEDAKIELTEIVLNEIAKILDVPSKELDLESSLNNLGFDSLMVFDLAVSLEKRIGISISRFAFQQVPNINKLSEILLTNILGVAEEQDNETGLLQKHGVLPNDK